LSLLVSTLEIASIYLLDLRTFPTSSFFSSLRKLLFIALLFLSGFLLTLSFIRFRKLLSIVDYNRSLLLEEPLNREQFLFTKSGVRLLPLQIEKYIFSCRKTRLPSVVFRIEQELIYSSSLFSYTSSHLIDFSFGFVFSTCFTSIVFCLTSFPWGPTAFWVIILGCTYGYH